MVDGVRKELGAIVLGTQIAVSVTTCLFEIWAYKDSVVSYDEKVTLSWCYGPFAVIPAIMAFDMVVRVLNRVETAEKAKVA
jgi:EXPERA (EXPanded EBP superfamily)